MLYTLIHFIKIAKGSTLLFGKGTVMNKYILKFRRKHIELLDIETGYLYETYEKLHLFKYLRTSMLCALLCFLLSITWYCYFEHVLLNLVMHSIGVGIDCTLWVHYCLDDLSDLKIVKRMSNSRLNSTRVNYIKSQLMFFFLYILQLVILHYFVSTSTITFLKFLFFLICLSVDVFLFCIHGKYWRL